MARQYPKHYFVELVPPFTNQIFGEGGFWIWAYSLPPLAEGYSKLSVTFTQDVSKVRSLKTFQQDVQ